MALKRSVSVIGSADTVFCDRQSVIGLKNPDWSTPINHLPPCHSKPVKASIVMDNILTVGWSNRIKVVFSHDFRWSRIYYTEP